MKVKVFKYTPFTYSRLSMVEGETFFANSPTSVTQQLGNLFIKGNFVKTKCPNKPEVVGEITGIDSHGGELYTTPSDGKMLDVEITALQDAEWVCFTKNETGDHTLTRLDVDGDFVLPANNGFVVISGSVVVDGLTADQDDYFRPRNVDLNGSGTAVLVLVE